MSFKVVITDFGDPDNAIESEVFHSSGLDINLVRLQTRAPEELIPYVADADGLIVQWATINRQVIDAMQCCKVISRYGIGVDSIDLDAATDHRIPVANVPDFCIDEVSTQTIGFLIDLNRHIIGLHDYVRAGKWGRAPITLSTPRRLQGQTLGIVGLGNIGRVVAQKAAALGVKLLGYDPYLKPEVATKLNVELVGLADLLRRSDYVSLHCPLNAETRHLIGAPELALMQPHAYLINLARGPVVDQAALVQALVDGKIAGAAMDVLDPEPPHPDDPLLQMSNVIITPHVSPWCVETLVQLRRDAAQNVVDVLQGKLPRSVVNRKGLGL